MIEWLAGPGALDEFNNWVVVFQHRPGMIEAILVALGVLLLAVLSVYNLKRLPSRGWRALLLGLRLLFLVGLLMLWLQPAIQLQKVLYKKSHVLVLADNSRSMRLSAGAGSQTRAEQAARFFDENSVWLSGLTRFHHLHAFSFDAEAKATSLDKLKAPLTADGEATSIANSIIQAMSGFNPGDVTGIVLVSDGVDNPPETAVPSMDEAIKLLREREVQVVAAAAGARATVKDIAISEVRYDGFAFVHNKMSIEIVVSSRGYPTRSVQVNLDRDNQPVGVEQVTVPENGEATVSFSFTPARVGRFVYTVAVPPSPDDAFVQNNRKRFVIDVIRDKIRVLHVSGHPDYDEQFLRRFLKNNPNVDLISFFILRTNADLQFVPERELSLIPFPTEELFSQQLHTFDLVIFQNFTYRGYEMKQYLPNIQRFVQSGGAFLTIGGDVSYGLGGYDQTAIEPILPFEIVPAEPGASAEPFTLDVTDEGLQHPIMRLAQHPEQSRALWQAMPKLLGLNLGLVPYPDSMVLAVHPELKIDGKPAPVIAARQVGEGRVVSLAIDSSWRWHMRDVAQGGTGEHYHTFWSKVIRWLIKDPDLKHLTVRADKDRVKPGGELRLDIRLTDRDFQPKPNARVVLKLYDAGEAVIDTRELRTDSDGAAMATVTMPPSEGMVRIEVTHQPAPLREGLVERVQKGEVLVFVSAGSSEFDKVDVDRATLQRLADATGGQFVDLPATMTGETPFARTQTARVGLKRDIPAWDNWPVLVILALLIGLEWWWRKRKRLN